MDGVWFSAFVCAMPYSHDASPSLLFAKADVARAGANRGVANLYKSNAIVQTCGSRERVMEDRQALAPEAFTRVFFCVLL